MNTKELLEEIGERTGLPAAKVRRVLGELVAIGQHELTTSGYFKLHDFVDLTVKDVKERSGAVNGVPWHKPAHKAVKARPVGKTKSLFA